jgi:hypothetical protein
VAGEKVVIGMALMRFLFGILGIAGALLMLKLKTVENAIKINGVLGSIGPFVFIGVSLLGLTQMVGRVSILKIGAIVVGMIMILWGTI